MIKPSELRALYQNNYLQLVIKSFEDRLKYEAGHGKTSTELPTIDQIRNTIFDWYHLQISDTDCNLIRSRLNNELMQAGYFIKDGMVSWS